MQCSNIKYIQDIVLKRYCLTDAGSGILLQINMGMDAVRRYSFIQMKNLRQCGANEIAEGLKWQQVDSNLGALD